MDNKGFIMISRSVLEDPMYLSEKFTRMQAYLDLCYMATFTDREFYIRGNKVAIHKGQIAKSVRNLSERWQWSVNTVIKYLGELKKSGYIDTQKTSVNQIITIKKYLLFNTQNDTQVDTQGDTQIKTQTKTQNDTSNNNIIEELNKQIEELKKEKEELANASKKKSKVFIPPSVEEVSAFIKEQGFHFDAISFVNFYESKGWLVGKNKMKDWKAACRTWEQKRQADLFAPQKREDIGVNYQGSNTGKYDNMELW